MKRFLPLLLSLLSAGCGYDDFDPVQANAVGSAAPNTELRNLAEMFKNGEIDLPEGTIAGGVVTTSDSTGNFYKTILIQQGSVGIGILTGLYDTYVSYRPGEKVVLKLDGLRLGIHESDGTLAIGSPNYADNGIDYIASEVMVRRMMERTTSESVSDIRVPVLTIPNVTQEHVGQLVRVTGGKFTQGGTRTWSGGRTYSQRQGVSLTVNTSPYATFAGDTLPEGEVDLTGIVTQYNGKLQLKINSADDACPTVH